MDTDPRYTRMLVVYGGGEPLELTRTEATTIISRNDLLGRALAPFASDGPTPETMHVPSRVINEIRLSLKHLAHRERGRGSAQILLMPEWIYVDHTSGRRFTASPRIHLVAAPAMFAALVDEFHLERKKGAPDPRGRLMDIIEDVHVPLNADAVFIVSVIQARRLPQVTMCYPYLVQKEQ